MFTGKATNGQACKYVDWFEQLVQKSMVKYILWLFTFTFCLLHQKFAEVVLSTDKSFCFAFAITFPTNQSNLNLGSCGSILCLCW